MSFLNYLRKTRYNYLSKKYDTYNILNDGNECQKINFRSIKLISCNMHKIINLTDYINIHKIYRKCTHDNEFVNSHTKRYMSLDYTIEVNKKNYCPIGDIDCIRKAIHFIENNLYKFIKIKIYHNNRISISIVSKPTMQNEVGKLNIYIGIDDNNVFDLCTFIKDLNEMALYLLNNRYADEFIYLKESNDNKEDIFYYRLHKADAAYNARHYYYKPSKPRNYLDIKESDVPKLRSALISFYDLNPCSTHGNMEYCQLEISYDKESNENIITVSRLKDIKCQEFIMILSYDEISNILNSIHIRK